MNIFEIAACLNNIRDNCSDIISDKKMAELLSDITGYSASTSLQLLSVAVKCTIIVKIGRGQYKFPDKPIYYKKLLTYSIEVRKHFNDYKKHKR